MYGLRRTTWLRRQEPLGLKLGVRRAALQGELLNSPTETQLRILVCHPLWCAVPWWYCEANILDVLSKANLDNVRVGGLMGED